MVYFKSNIRKLSNNDDKVIDNALGSRHQNWVFIDKNEWALVVEELQILMDMQGHPKEEAIFALQINFKWWEMDVIPPKQCRKGPKPI